MQSAVTLSSLLDNDFYKFTMQQCVVKLFPTAQARYAFINRGHHSFPQGLAAALRASVDAMAGLKLTKEEKRFLKVNCPYLDPVYLDLLQGYCYDPSEVVIKQQEDQLQVLVEGLWYRTILWEVPLLCLISENFYRLMNRQRISNDAVENRTKEKIEKYKALDVTIAEFGTRRRHSYEVHQHVVKTLKHFGGSAFVGTSNVH
ncbi:MAG: nicotinate phosphoribosyltransferase, partial [Flavisolibacter sp.]|nr:nicotinate phosphoribosyltransferase [Flavisolibacter sp.]